MTWAIVTIVLLAAALAAAHRLLSTVFAQGVGASPVARVLWYSSAVVVGAGVASAAITIDSQLDAEFGRSGDALVVTSTITTTAASIAFQAGLLLAAAVLVARRSTGRDT